MVPEGLSTRRKQRIEEMVRPLGSPMHGLAPGLGFRGLGLRVKGGVHSEWLLAESLIFTFLSLSSYNSL